MKEVEELRDRISVLEEKVRELEGKESSPWMTVQQAMKRLHISKPTFYELVKKGRVTLYKISEESRAVRVKRAEIDQLFKPIQRAGRDED